MDNFLWQINRPFHNTPEGEMIDQEKVYDELMLVDFLNDKPIDLSHYHVVDKQVLNENLIEDNTEDTQLHPYNQDGHQSNADEDPLQNKVDSFHATNVLENHVEIPVLNENFEDSTETSQVHVYIDNSQQNNEENPLLNKVDSFNETYYLINYAAEYPSSNQNIIEENPESSQLHVYNEDPQQNNANEEDPLRNKVEYFNGTYYLENYDVENPILNENQLEDTSEANCLHEITGKATYQCEKCPYSTDLEGYLQFHLTNVHNEPSKCLKSGFETAFIEWMDKNKQCTSEQLDCLQCNFRTNSRTSLKQHVQQKHARKNVIFKCPYCNFNADSEITYGQHLGKCKKSREPITDEALALYKKLREKQKRKVIDMFRTPQKLEVTQPTVNKCSVVPQKLQEKKRTIIVVSQTLDSSQTTVNEDLVVPQKQYKMQKQRVANGLDKPQERNVKQTTSSEHLLSLKPHETQKQKLISKSVMPHELHGRETATKRLLISQTLERTNAAGNSNPRDSDSMKFKYQLVERYKSCVNKESKSMEDFVVPQKQQQRVIDDLVKPQRLNAKTRSEDWLYLKPHETQKQGLNAKSVMPEMLYDVTINKHLSIPQNLEHTNSAVNANSGDDSIQFTSQLSNSCINKESKSADADFVVPQKQRVTDDLVKPQGLNANTHREDWLSLKPHETQKQGLNANSVMPQMLYVATNDKHLSIPQNLEHTNSAMNPNSGDDSIQFTPQLSNSCINKESKPVDADFVVPQKQRQRVTDDLVKPQRLNAKTHSEDWLSLKPHETQKQGLNANSVMPQMLYVATINKYLSIPQNLEHTNSAVNANSGDDSVQFTSQLSNSCINKESKPVDADFVVPQKQRVTDDLVKPQGLNVKEATLGGDLLSLNPLETQKEKLIAKSVTSQVLYGQQTATIDKHLSIPQNLEHTSVAGKANPGDDSIKFNSQLSYSCVNKESKSADADFVVPQKRQGVTDDLVKPQGLNAEQATTHREDLLSLQPPEMQKPRLIVKSLRAQLRDRKQTVTNNKHLLIPQNLVHPNIMWKAKLQDTDSQLALHYKSLVRQENKSVGLIDIEINKYLHNSMQTVVGNLAFRCVDCNYVSNNLLTLDEHIKEKHEFVRCVLCDFQSTKKFSYSDHFKMVHSSVITPTKLSTA